jgi:alpha-tubulin suppressor-like RCC1 family protein
MRVMRCRDLLWTLPAALAAGLLGCESAMGPAQQPPSAATKLAFTVQPTNAAGAQPITPAVQVAVQDAVGNTVSTATNAVTVTLGNPGGGTLGGTMTVSAAQGIATFADLRIDQPGSGYTLGASAAGLSGATSTQFAVTLTFDTVTAGDAHTCGVAAGGAAYCWGYNSSGQLGDGTTTDRLTPVLVQPPTGVSFAAVTAGRLHTCGVTAAGPAYCWGGNSFGQLGDGTPTTRLTPVPVAPGVSFAAVDAGDFHTCGVTAAGTAYCWGSNSVGQLGDGTTTPQSSPVLVKAPAGVSFAAVTAGAAHTCGVTAAGVVYCWGANGSGQLGDGTTTDRLTPVLVAPGVSFAAVTAGRLHTCGVTPTAYCWGSNSVGQLGDGTTIDRSSPVLVQPPTGVSFAAVTAGYSYTCGLATLAGTAPSCWGGNGFGQLGDGTATDRLTPVPVASPAGVSFVAVTAGTAHTCGVTAAGVAYCWGANGSGQLGDGTTTGRLTPARVVQ